MNQDDVAEYLRAQHGKAIAVTNVKAIVRELLIDEDWIVPIGDLANGAKMQSGKLYYYLVKILREANEKKEQLMFNLGKKYYCPKNHEVKPKAGGTYCSQYHETYANNELDIGITIYTFLSMKAPPQEFLPPILEKMLGSLSNDELRKIIEFSAAAIASYKVLSPKTNWPSGVRSRI